MKSYGNYIKIIWTVFEYEDDCDYCPEGRCGEDHGL